MNRQLRLAIACFGFVTLWGHHAASQDPAFLLAVDLKCPTPDTPIFILTSMNRLGQRDRISIVFSEGKPEHTAVAAAEKGAEFETYYQGPAGNEHGQQVIRATAKYLDACQAGGSALDEVIRELGRNAVELRAAIPHNSRMD